MKLSLPLRCAIATLVFSVSATVCSSAQDDNDTPLGDVARHFRKKPTSQPVIDNDNLPQVVQEAESHRSFGSSLRYTLDALGKSFQVSAPDVTCSLSFSAKAQALLSSQYSQLDLPSDELRKLDGPAKIDGGSLEVSIFNGTEWHVSEVAVALTLLKKEIAAGPAAYLANPQAISAADNFLGQDPANLTANLPEKRSDTTFLYRMRAAAVPSAVTLFRAPLTVDIAPDQEWHWAIVQARGYPPEHIHDVTSTILEPIPAHPDPEGEPTISVKH